MTSKRQSQGHPPFLSGSVFNGLKVFPLCFLTCSRLCHRNFPEGFHGCAVPLRVSWTLQAYSFLLGLTILLTSIFEILWTLLFSFWRISVHFSVFFFLIIINAHCCMYAKCGINLLWNLLKYVLHGQKYPVWCFQNSDSL